MSLRAPTVKRTHGTPRAETAYRIPTKTERAFGRVLRSLSARPGELGPFVSALDVRFLKVEAKSRATVEAGEPLPEN